MTTLALRELAEQMAPDTAMLAVGTARQALHRRSRLPRPID